jgi:hypothetical protein
MLEYPKNVTIGIDKVVTYGNIYSTGRATQTQVDWRTVMMTTTEVGRLQTLVNHASELIRLRAIIDDLRGGIDGDDAIDIETRHSSRANINQKFMPLTFDSIRQALDQALLIVQKSCDVELAAIEKQIKGGAQ